MEKSIKYIFLLVLIQVVLVSGIHAAAVSWDGGGGDNLWNTPANWSDDNIPGIDDDVTIDASALVLLSGANGNVKSLTVNPGNTLEVASGINLTIDEDIIINGVMTLLGTPSLNVGRNWIRTGVFNPNSSTVIFSGSASGQIQNEETFYNFTLNKNSNKGIINQGTGPVKITVLNDLYLQSGFFDVKALTGTEMDVNGSLTIAAGNSDALRLGDTAADGITVELSGNFINNNNTEKSFVDGDASTIVFDGTTTQQIVTAITLDGEVFENIIVRKPDGINLNLASNIQIEGDLEIESGIFKYNGNYLTFGTDAADSVIIGGLMDVDNASDLKSALLRMAAGSSLIVNDGGVLRVVGISLQPAIVSGITGTFNFEINSNGTIQAQNYKFEYVDADGIELKDGAIIDPVYNFSNGAIDHIAPAGTGLNVGDIAGNDQRLRIQNVAFPTNPGEASNVRKSFSTDTLEFVKASGSFAGEDFDDDPYDLVEWSSSLLTRIWTGQQSEAWSDPDNWNPSGVPADTENVIIPEVSKLPYPVISSGANCNDLLIREGAILTVNSGLNLNVNGNLSIGDTVTATDGTLTLTGSASINIAGHYFKTDRSSFNCNTSTVIFNGTTDQYITTGGVDLSDDAFYNLTVNKPSGTVRLGDAIYLNGTFNVQDGTFDANGQAMSVALNWLNSGTFISGDNTVTFLAPATGPFTITGGSSAFHHILIEAGNSANTYRLGSNLHATGDVTITDGILNANGFNTDIDGSFTNSMTFVAGPTTNIGGNWTNTGTFTAGTGAVVFDGAGDQSINTGGTGTGRSFYHFTVNKTGGIANLTNNLDVNGNFTIQNGTLNTSSRSINVAGNWSNSGTWQRTGGTVYFDAASGGPYTITSTGSGAFYDFILNASGFTYRLNTDIRVDNNFNLGGGYLQAQGHDIYLVGSWINNSYYTPGGGRVVFIGSANQDINNGGTGSGKVFDHILVNKSGGTLKSISQIKTNGDFIIQAGTFNMNGRNLNVGGSFTNAGVISNAATLTMDALSGGPYNFSGGNSGLNIVTFNAAGIVYMMTGNSTLLGNLTVSAGHFDLNGNRLTFGNGATDVISVGGILEVDAGAELSMFNGSSLTVNSGGTIRVTGSSGNLATVTEQSKAGLYNFTVASNATIQARHALFEYMGASGINIQTGAIIDATNNFSDVMFDNGQPAGAMLMVGDINGNNQRLDIVNAAFLSNPGSGAHNVTHTIGSDTLNFVQAVGPFAGEDFDNDIPADNLITWTSPSITRIWDGSASSEWTNPDNWKMNIVPVDTEDVIIPATGVSSEPAVSGIISCRNLTIAEGRTLTVSTGSTLDLGGYVHNNGTITMTGSSFLRIAGDYDNIHGIFNDDVSTVVFYGNLTQTIKTGGTGNVKRFYNLQINKTGGSAVLNSALEVNNNFTITTGTFDANGQNMSIANNWINTGTFIHGGNTVTFDAQSAGPFLISGDGSDFNNILINAGNDLNTYRLGSNLQANGNLTITHGVLNANGFYMDIDGSFTNSTTFIAGAVTNVGGNWTNGGTFTAGSGSVIFDGALNQTIATGGTGAGRLFNNFVINKSGGTATLSADLDVNGNLTISNGTLNSGSGNLSVAGSWSNSGTWVQSGGAVTFDPTSGGPYNISTTGTGPFNNLIFSAAGFIYQMETGLDVNGDLNLNGGDLQAQGSTINLAGNWVNNATYTPAGGTVVFDGAVNQAVTSGGITVGKMFDHFTVNKTAGNLRLNSNIKVGGNLTVIRGVFDLNIRNANIAGNFTNSGTIVNPQIVTFDGLSGGPYSINGGASALNVVEINAPGIIYQLGGNTTINGNLTVSSGQLDLNGRQLIFGDGNDILSVGGMLEVDAGAILAMSDLSSLVVNTGGTIRVVGSTGNRATVTRQAQVGSYSFTINAGATIHALYALFEYMGSNGINILTGATIDPVNNFSNVTFDHGQPGGTLLRVEDITGAEQALTITGAAFPTNPGSNAHNVTKTNSSDTLIFQSASGSFAGENYDNDPLEPSGNLIQWGEVSNLRSWTGTTSTNWHTANNWNPLGVPSSNEDVEIKATTNQPIIEIENSTARNVTLFPGAVLTLKDGYDLDINGDFVNANGTLTVSLNSSTIYLAGNWYNNGTFSNGNGSVILDGNTKQLLDGGLGSAKAFNHLILANPDTVQLTGSLDVNGNLDVTAGILHTDGQIVQFGDASSDRISVDGVFHVDNSSILEMAAGSGIMVNSGGTLRVLGSSDATRPTITNQGSGNYSIEVNDGATLDTKLAIFTYTGGNGIYVHSGAVINPLSKFDYNLFQNGTGMAYLTIENNQSLIINRVQFDSTFIDRASYNVNYLGSGVIAFSNYRGTMSGVNFENDNGAGSRGNVRWYFTQTEEVSSRVTFGNDLVISTSDNLGSVSVELFDRPVPQATDSSVARFYTVEPTNNGVAALTLYYGDSELQGEVEEDLMIWRRRHGVWSLMGGNVNTSHNYVEISTQDYSFSAGVKDTLIISDATDDTSLPVELIAFEAFIKGKDVVLQWQTGSEIENALWYIDRKTLSREEYDQIEAGELELENSLRDYIRIATMEGQGSITSRTDYEYIDRNVPMSEVFAYRLADVSFNGEISFHTPVLVVPDAIPMDFALMQNYPNPFNPRTTIKYQLPEQSKVTFKIYNILGQEVVTLLDEQVAPGYYEVNWNGRNNFEQQVASGVYIYRIIAVTLDGKNRYVVSKRMNLLR